MFDLGFIPSSSAAGAELDIVQYKRVVINCGAFLDALLEGGDSGRTVQLSL
jgi:hypothetical protein